MQTQDEVTQFNVSQAYYTGLPEDVIVNTFHMIFTGPVLPTVTDYGNAADNFKTFYDAIYATDVRAPWVTSLYTIKAYSLWLTPPHVPAFVATRSNGSVAASAGQAPPEMAICLSMKANYVSGVAQSRQRGRIYLGGFAAPLSNGTGTSFPSVASATRIRICNAAAALKTNMAADSWTWVILSPTQVKAGGGAQETFDVAGGWVDDAPDTQRRRGNDPTARSTWS